MNLSHNTQAILLLTGYFKTSASSDTKPLTVGEWSRLADYMKTRKIQPSQFLEVDYSALLDGFSDKIITADRIDVLLKRGNAMALALEKWSRAGIWVISRADREYPARFKKKLGPGSPPILYGCGNKALLNQGGVGVVGSRNVSQSDLDYTLKLGAKVAVSGFSIVSGGAKGVDQAAMSAALEVDGTVVGVMADSLLKASTSLQYRQYIKSHSLVLLSPFYPEAGFNAGNAMQRNKYIYCLSDAAVVVHSGKPEGKKNGGGTWTGSLENLKKGWVPLWVKQCRDESAGNAQIVEKGGHWLSGDIEKISIKDLLKVPVDEVSEIQDDLFSEPSPSASNPGVNEPDVATPKNETHKEPSPVQSNNSGSEDPLVSFSQGGTIYDYFLVCAKPYLLEAQSSDELAKRLDVNKTQLNTWLKKAVDNGDITKLNRPVRYQWARVEALDESLS